MSLAFKLSRGVLNTITPPIPLAYTWATKYRLSHGPLLDMSQYIHLDTWREYQVSLRSPRYRKLWLWRLRRLAASVTARLKESLFSVRQWQTRCALYTGDTIAINASDMSLTSGCNLAFVATIMTLADAGDEVILPVPWYFNHHMTLTMLGITTVPLKTRPEDGFIPSVSECQTLITSKTRAIVLITPNNPTGATYSPEVIADFSRLAHERGIALIVDETYRDFITTELPPHSLFSKPSWREHLIHLFSFSKAYGVPGHRLGLVVASPTFHTSLGKVLDTLQICPPRPIQLAIAPILASLRPGVIQTALALEARREIFRAHLPPGWSIGSIGGYFAFVRHPFPGHGSAEVCQRLAEELGIVVLPAAFFAAELDESEDRWIRFSVANCDDDRVRAVCARLTKCEAVFGWEKEA
ncbi:Aspartate aminotransferase [Mycena sanguinolenta]|uniref:Aspartate aminotransferase n=1 Tax=Mycena sanguinolenta TaxID=230812 RepID=A0A8H6YVE9_9AGAR|nr:Aspartate aminotransferase [Mycena sanguinolenta]